MTRSLSAWQAIVLALVLLLGGVGAVVGLFAVGGRYWPWDDGFRIHAGFPKVHGVEPGTPVRVLGIKAGEVEKVQWVSSEKGVGVQLVLRLERKVDGTDVRSLIRANATARIVDEGMVGGKVVEISPGDAADPVAENGHIEGKPGGGLADTLAQIEPLAGAGLETIHQIKKTAEQAERFLVSAQRAADALSRIPGVGDYIDNPLELLSQPRHEINPFVFAADDLFEPNKATLTTRGRQKLDEAAPRMTGFTQKGTNVVVVSYADSRNYADPKSSFNDPRKLTPDQAYNLTKHRSEAVAEYLKTGHNIHGQRLWGWWWSDRKVRTLGMGFQPPPVPPADGLPRDPSRTEVLVFVPQI